MQSALGEGAPRIGHIRMGAVHPRSGASVSEKDQWLGLTGPSASHLLITNHCQDHLPNKNLITCISKNHLVGSYWFSFVLLGDHHIPKKSLGWLGLPWLAMDTHPEAAELKNALLKDGKAPHSLGVTGRAK